MSSGNIRRSPRRNRGAFRRAIWLRLPLREGASDVKLSDVFRVGRTAADPVEIAVANHQARTGIELKITRRVVAGVWEAEDATGKTWQSPSRNRLLMALLEYLAEQPDRA